MAAKKGKAAVAKGKKGAADKASKSAKGDKKRRSKRLSKDSTKSKKLSYDEEKVQPTKPEPKLPPPPPPKPDPCENYVPDECFENVTCKFNEYPGLLDKPKPMAIVGSETGSFKSLRDLLEAGLRCADRVLLMTPWGNYVTFRANKPSADGKKITEELTYFLYDGCTCNVNSFRHLDLQQGAAGFITFENISSLVAYILNSRYRREKMGSLCKPVLDDICIEKQPTGEEEAPLETDEQAFSN